MLFNTIQYILFLPLVTLIYYILPSRIRYIWILIVSYFFYMQWNPSYIGLLFLCSLITYVGGRIIENLQCLEAVNQKTVILKTRKKRKICLVICIMLNMAMLGFFKYFEFGVNCLNHLLRCVSLKEISWNHTFLLPVGISFYILQALGYLIDVYRGDIKVEKNFMRYALFISFFPQLVAGPIERSKNLLKQLQDVHPLKYENIRNGIIFVLYGLFLKMVIADRAAIIVNTVYGNSAAYPGFYIVVATIFFSIQIYCDFYGYSTIARGSALMLGIHLLENFEAPYFSKSIKEFWRRWHISLSGWFREYLYIPLGGNRKGEIKKMCNLLVVFGVSGLWHGASMTYIFWGFLNGIYQVIADIIAKGKRLMEKTLNETLKRLNCEQIDFDIAANRFSTKIFRTIGTFILVTFAWLFFRAGGSSEARELVKNMLSVNNWTILFDGSLYELGVEKNYLNVLLISIFALFIIDYFKYKGRNVVKLILQQGWFFRMLVVMAAFFTILLYGCYGEMYDVQQFIYFQF